jgi:hypothetical protein
VYGLAMVIVGIAALIVGPLAPKSLFYFREAEGKMIQSLYWTNNTVYDDLFACFQPFERLDKIDNRGIREHDDDTIYKEKATDYEKGISNFTRNHILNLRRNHIFFSNPPLKKLGSEERFVSASYADVREMQIANTVSRLQKINRPFLSPQTSS